METLETQSETLPHEATKAEAPRRIDQLMLDAVKGVQHDFTQGSIRKAVVLLAVPMVLEMLMESIFALVDMFFVSRLGPGAAAVVGLTEAVITLIYALAIGLAMAATAVVARRIGEKDLDGAARTAGQVLWVGLAISLLVGSAGYLFAEDILAFMGADAAVIEQGRGYTSIMLGGSLTVVYLFLINAIFRGAGNASMAMWGLALANGINIILDPCLIFGLGPFPEMGVTGAAVATNIGRGVGVLFLAYHLFAKDARLPIRWEHLRWNFAIVTNLLRVSFGGIFQFFIGTASWVVLMKVIALFGTNAVAGYTIAIRVVAFTFLPAWGLSNAAATLVGQNLGAKNPARAEQSVWQTAKYNFIFMMSVAVVLFSLGEPIMRLFIDDPEVVAYGRECLRIISYGYGLFAIGMVLTQAFNGAGDTLTPTWINFLCFWMIQIPFAYVAATIFNWGPTGVFISITLAESLIAVIAYWQFKRGKWKLKEV